MFLTETSTSTGREVLLSPSSGLLDLSLLTPPPNNVKVVDGSKMKLVMPEAF